MTREFIIENGSGIYAITNTITNERYIGSTNNFIKRYKSHKADILKGYHKNKKLMRAVIKHGLDNFTFTILVYSDNTDMLLSIEDKYIKKFNTIDCGYNISKVLIPKVKVNKIQTQVGINISKGKLKNREKLGKTYKVIDPNGIVIKVINLKLYCDSNNLYAPAFRRMANGGRNYKGYKSYKKI